MSALRFLKNKEKLINSNFCERCVLYGRRRVGEIYGVSESDL